MRRPREGTRRQKAVPKKLAAEASRQKQTGERRFLLALGERLTRAGLDPVWILACALIAEEDLRKGLPGDSPPSHQRQLSQAILTSLAPNMRTASDAGAPIRPLAFEGLLL